MFHRFISRAMPRLSLPLSSPSLPPPFTNIHTERKGEINYDIYRVEDKQFSWKNGPRKKNIHICNSDLFYVYNLLLFSC